VEIGMVLCCCWFGKSPDSNFTFGTEPGSRRDAWFALTTIWKSHPEIIMSVAMSNVLENEEMSSPSCSLKPKYISIG
jgi:hypothetical protein